MGIEQYRSKLPVLHDFLQALNQATPPSRCEAVPILGTVYIKIDKVDNMEKLDAMKSFNGNTAKKAMTTMLLMMIPAGQVPVLGAVKLESDTPNPILSFPPSSYPLPFAHLLFFAKLNGDVK